MTALPGKHTPLIMYEPWQMQNAESNQVNRDPWINVAAGTGMHCNGGEDLSVYLSWRVSNLGHRAVEKSGCHAQSTRTAGNGQGHTPPSARTHGKKYDDASKMGVKSISWACLGKKLAGYVVRRMHSVECYFSNRILDNANSESPIEGILLVIFLKQV